MKATWKDFVKSAGLAVPSAEKRAQAAIKPRAGANPVPTPAPSDAEMRANNIFNMRNYNQGWKGEVTTGLKRGDRLKFKTKQDATRAGARLVMNLLNKRTPNKTIRELIPIFSPPNENNTNQHMMNVARNSGIGLDTALNTNDDNQMFRILTGLAMSETPGALKGLSQKDILQAIRDARTSW